MGVSATSLFLVPLFLTSISANSAKEIFRKDGDANVAVILRNDCNTTATLTQSEQSLVNAAIWTTHKLDNLEMVPLTFGLSVHKTCNEKEEYQTIFELFQRRNEDILLGLVTTSKFSAKIHRFCDALDLTVKQVVKCPLPLVKACVALLSALNWIDNVTVLTPNEVILSEFSRISRKASICVHEYLVTSVPPTNFSSAYSVIFGNHDFLTSMIKKFDFENAILVPLDSALNEFPDGTYVISSAPLDDEEQAAYTLNPQFFEIAIPLVTYPQILKQFIADNCNGSNDKLCVKTKFRGYPQTVLKPSKVVDLLKIETSSINYYIYKSENASFLPTKAFIYNFFTDNLTQLSQTDVNNTSKVCKGTCQKQCKNFEKHIFIPEDCEVRIRSESWVFAFLSLSLLGVLLCIAILIFLLVSICRRNVLEGNPVLTMLLLVTVMLMYCSILPLSLEGCRNAKESVCVARALAVTLSFSAAFSLILSRSILLATACKEIGFMSHVAGPVQSFLCLFIFGVQAALSLQVINRCGEIFRGYSFIYLLSYNAMLLLLLLCLCPLIIKSQRNYKEGKYFTFAVITISFLWCLWVPAYALLDEKLKDSVLCFGLVSTASALMGTIFVPRTYLMTIAAARDKMTSTLPSLAAATSAMDIYRAGAQPVYDCVNVAAINAVTVARAGITSIQQPDLYSCPNLPEDDDYDVRCDTPVNDDKVTRF